MDNNNNIIDMKPLIKSQSEVEDSFKMRAKYQSNPIFKKYFVINAKNNVHKFSITDLFD